MDNLWIIYGFSEWNPDWLVVEPCPSEKYEFVSWDDYSQKMENKKNPNHQPKIEKLKTWKYLRWFLSYLSSNYHPDFTPSRPLCWGLPSGNLTWLWKISIFHGKIHYKLPFSIAMLNYWGVSINPIVRSGELWRNASSMAPSYLFSSSAVQGSYGTGWAMEIFQANIHQHEGWWWCFIVLDFNQRKVGLNITWNESTNQAWD